MSIHLSSICDLFYGIFCVLRKSLHIPHICKQGFCVFFQKFHNFSFTVCAMIFAELNVTVK